MQSVRVFNFETDVSAPEIFRDLFKLLLLLQFYLWRWIVTCEYGNRWKWRTETNNKLAKSEEIDQLKKDIKEV